MDLKRQSSPEITMNRTCFSDSDLLHGADHRVALTATKVDDDTNVTTTGDRAAETESKAERASLLFLYAKISA